MYSLTELAEKCGYARTTVKDWITLFERFIPSVVDEEGRVYFNNDSVEYIHYIKKLRDRKLRKDELDDFLKENGKPIDDEQIDNTLGKHLRSNLNKSPTPRQITFPYLHILKRCKFLSCIRNK